MADPERPQIRRNPDGTFPKGVSGNPGGRPPDPFRRALRERLEREADQVVQRLWDASEAGDATSIAAIRTMLEYAIGKPAMAVEDREAMAAAQGGGLEALFGLYGIAVKRTTTQVVQESAPELPPASDEGEE